jgi:hypothetical protein
METNFQSVDFEKRADLQPITFIDKTTSKSILFTFLTFLLFVSAYVYTAFHSPSVSKTTTTHYPLTQAYNNRMADVKIRLSPLNPDHRFIRFRAALKRHGIVRELTDFVIVNTSLEFYSGDVKLNSYEGQHIQFRYSFKSGSEISNQLLLFDRQITNFDGLNIAATFQADLFFCKGFELSYSYADPSLVKFRNTIRVVLCLSAAYTFAGFVFSLKSERPSQFQFASIILGVATVFATNPIGLLLPGSWDSLIEIFTIPLFLGTFRWFVFFLLDSSIHDDDTLFKSWSRFYIPFIVIYSFLEMLAGLQPRPFISTALAAFHEVYTGATIVLLGAAFLLTVDQVHFRVVAFSPFILTTTVMTVISEVLLPRFALAKESSLPLLLYLATHIFTSIVFLFFHHTSTEKKVDHGFE